MTKYRGLILASGVGLIVAACAGDDVATGLNAGGGASSGSAGKAGAATQGKSGNTNGGTSAPGNLGGAGGERASTGDPGTAGTDAAGGFAGNGTEGGTGGAPLQTDPNPGGAGAGGAACVPQVFPLTAVAQPVDVIFVIDNSPSMAAVMPQINAGLNKFAATLAATDLDYKVIALSVRAKTNPVTIGGNARYGICVPPPLAGDDNCGNGERFFQSDVNIQSTQLLEQVLGTFGQTTGYTAADALGGPAWKDQLRPKSARHIVVVTDNDARLSAEDFGYFAGGPNPFNGNLSLPPGLLTAGTGFVDYTFHGVFGWRLQDDPDAICSYPDQSKPAASGAVYTELVLDRGGVRAQICYGAALWDSFFASVASVVTVGAQVACEFPVPDVPFDPETLQLRLDSGAKHTFFGGEASIADCGPIPVFVYDDWEHPTSVSLCNNTCDKVNDVVGPGQPGKLNAVIQCF